MKASQVFSIFLSVAFAATGVSVHADASASGFEVKGSAQIGTQKTNSDVLVLEAEEGPVLKEAIKAAIDKVDKSDLSEIVPLVNQDGSAEDKAIVTTAQTIAKATHSPVVEMKVPRNLQALVKRHAKKLKVSIAILRGSTIGSVVTTVLVSRHIPIDVAASAGLFMGTAALILGLNGARYLKYVSGGSNLFSQEARVFSIESAKLSVVALIMSLTGHGSGSALADFLKVAASAGEVTAIKGSFDIAIDEIEKSHATEENREVLALVRDLTIAGLAVTEKGLAVAQMAGWHPAEYLLLGMSAAGVVVLAEAKQWPQKLWRKFHRTAICEEALIPAE